MLEVESPRKNNRDEAVRMHMLVEVKADRSAISGKRYIRSSHVYKGMLNTHGKRMRF